MVAGGACHVTAGAHHEGPGPGDRGEDFADNVKINNRFELG